MPGGPVELEVRRGPELLQKQELKGRKFFIHAFLFPLAFFLFLSSLKYRYALAHGTLHSSEMRARAVVRGGRHSHPGIAFDDLYGEHDHRRHGEHRHGVLR